jgi:hypothetical protein
MLLHANATTEIVQVKAFRHPNLSQLGEKRIMLVDQKKKKKRKQAWI